MAVVAFRHMTGDGLGSLAQFFRSRDIAYEYVDTPHTDLRDFDPLAPRLLVVLGGSPGVYQEDLYPFLTEEKRIIKARLEADRPTLGICLGSQLMAAALGARVYQGEQGQERGWFPLRLTAAGAQSPVTHLAGEKTSMLHWHGDTFDFPEGAVLLARSEKYEHQAFSYGKHCLGLQCHPEMTPRHIEDWLVGGAGEVARGTLDAAQIRRDTAAHGARLIDQTALFMTEYLGQCGLLPQKTDKKTDKEIDKETGKKYA